MRKLSILAGTMLAFGSTYASLAQDAAPSAEAPVAAPAAAAEAPATVPAPPVIAAMAGPASAPACELHVFPTLEGQAQTTGWLMGFGMVGAVVDAAAHKDANINDAEYLKNALGPEFQVSALKTIDLVKELKLPEGTQVSYETPIADRGITTKAKTRLSSSTASCYAELIVTQNFYKKAAIYGRSLNNRFIFKDFRDGKTQAELVKGRGGNGLSHFPPETPADRPAANEDLRNAFTKNFLEYSKSI
jgi:hypothetical protein